MGAWKVPSRCQEQLTCLELELTTPKKSTLPCR